VTTERLETFADGVFAIAATLLILNVGLQGGGSIAHQLVNGWVAYAAYAVSFLTIGIMWVNHHAIMEQVGHADRPFLLLNVCFLLCVAFMPFPTRVLADHLRGDGGRAAAVFYGLAMLATAVFFNVIWQYGRRRLLREDADPRTVLAISRSFAPGVTLYLVATLVALVSAAASAALYAAIAVFYVSSGERLVR
jgi:TMEM175 potassium channel family protein